MKLMLTLCSYWLTPVGDELLLANPIWAQVKKRIVVVMARQHPGESPSSFVVQGLISDRSFSVVVHRNCLTITECLNKISLYFRIEILHIFYYYSLHLPFVELSGP
jgi:hypothetical protein